MPQKRNLLGWLGLVLSASAIAIGLIGSAYRVFVVERLLAGELKTESVEMRVTALEKDQLEEKQRTTESLHQIDKQLMALNIGVSNVVEILRSHTEFLSKHQAKISGGVW